MSQSNTKRKEYTFGYDEEHGYFVVADEREHAYETMRKLIEFAFILLDEIEDTDREVRH